MSFIHACFKYCPCSNYSKRKISNHKNDYWTESLTPQRLLAVFFIQLNEGYQINVLYPFVVFMVRDFDFEEEAVGLYAGLLTATFALCQFVSSYFWGQLSDRYGRKITLLIGILISGFAILIFGTSTSYIQAVAARSIAGIFNGNIGVARAYVADITTGHNRAFAFSIFVIGFSAGMILGSTCGGALIHTYNLDDNGNHKQSVGVLQWWILASTFPYLLPCVVGCCISFISFGFIMRFIEDIDSTSTHTKAWEISLHKLSTARDEEMERSRTHSLPTPSMSTRSFEDIDNRRHSLDTVDATDEINHISLIEMDAMSGNALYEGFHSVALTSNEGERSKLLKDDVKIDSLLSMFRETEMVHGLLINATIMVMFVAWNALVPLLLAQSLEMDSFEIGLYMVYNGIVLFVFTWWVQPPLLKRFNYKSLYIVFGIGMLCVIIIFPSITLIPGIHNWNNVTVLVLTSFIGAFKYVFSTNLFVVSMCFINNSVPQNVMGRANGLAQALGAGLRGLGPLIGGALWSWSMTMSSDFSVYITYMFMIIPSVYSVIHCVFFIDRNIQMTWNERRDNKSPP